MGKHSPQPRRRQVSGRPARIERLEPASSFRETPRQAAQRRRQSSRIVDPRSRQRRRRRRLTVTLTVLLLFIIGTGTAAFAYFKHIDDKIHPVDPALPAVLDPKTPHTPGAPFYMVIMGTDTRPGEKVARSDTLLVARVDPKTKRISAMSIPRDTRVNIPGHGTEKINAAMQRGGPALVIQTVKEFTGLPITQYVNMDFTGFKDIVNALGGVTVYVPEAIDDIQAAGGHPSSRYVPKGWQKLDGAHALTFVRARHQFADQDFSRVRNQQAFLKALAKQTAKVSPFALPGVINAVAEAVTTSLPLSDIYGLARDFRGMPDTNIDTITMPGSAKFINGVSYVVADDAALRKVLDRMKAGEPLSGKSVVPTSTVDASGVKSANTNLPVTVTPSQVTLTVRNGAGVSGLAASVATKMTGLGFKVIETGNMNQSVYSKTLIVYKTDTEKATVAREALGLGDVVASRGMYTFKTDILIVVGKDWDPAKAGLGTSRP